MSIGWFIYLLIGAVLLFIWSLNAQMTRTTWSLPFFIMVKTGIATAIVLGYPIIFLMILSGVLKVERKER
jgi:hypothetical protein